MELIYSFWQLSIVTILGCIFFPTLFHVILEIQKKVNSLSVADRHVISLRVVSAIQAFIASVSGYIIVTNCQNHPIQDRHWLTDVYTCFGVPYFYYDTWAMYLTYWHKTPQVQNLPASQAVISFVKYQPLMMAHHLLFPIIYFPIIMYWRQGAGDFYIGCFYLIELAVPFISLRSILVQLKKEETLLYVVNGVVLILMWTVCRVLVFPYMFYIHGNYTDVPVWMVPLTIPKKCVIGCVGLLAFQLYWLSLMINIAVKRISRYMKKKESKKKLGKAVNVDKNVIINAQNHVKPLHMS